MGQRIDTSNHSREDNQDENGIISIINERTQLACLKKGQAQEEEESRLCKFIIVVWKILLLKMRIIIQSRFRTPH